MSLTDFYGQICISVYFSHRFAVLTESGDTFVQWDADHDEMEDYRMYAPVAEHRSYVRLIA